MWVPTNEPVGHPNFDQKYWGDKVIYPKVKALDLTRPVLRSGNPNAEILDMHSYDGFWGGSEGEFREGVTWQARDRDPAMPIFNSEYIAGYHGDSLYRLTGSDSYTVASDKYYASVGARQTSCCLAERIV